MSQSETANALGSTRDPQVAVGVAVFDGVAVGLPVGVIVVVGVGEGPPPSKVTATPDVYW